MSGTRPLIAAKFNGRDVRFIIDSGAFYSLISAAAAREYELKLRSGPNGLTVTGVGGSFKPEVATVKVFTLDNLNLPDVQFLVGGSEVGSGSVGVLGQNLLSKWDVEYDLAKGMIRLLRVEDCKKSFLAYWLAPGQAYTLLDIGWTSPLEPHTSATAYLNGEKIRVIFDTGAAASMLSRSAAQRAGVRLDAPGVVDSGYSSGIGRGAVKTYIARFDSFKFADGEEIKHARLRIAAVDLNLPAGADMLLGADFFLSHRILVAGSQHKMYFTYNGGPVFNLSTSPEVQPASTPDASMADASADTKERRRNYGRRS